MMTCIYTYVAQGSIKLYMIKLCESKSENGECVVHLYAYVCYFILINHFLFNT